MVGPLGPSARARVPCSFVAPRACAVAAFVRPRFRTAQCGRHLAIVDALLVARLAAEPLFGGFASTRPGSGSLGCPRAIPATSALRVSSPSVQPELAPSSQTTSAPSSSSSRVTAADFNRSNSKGECDPSNRPREALPMQEWRVGSADPLTRTVGVAVRG